MKEYYSAIIKFDEEKKYKIICRKCGFLPPEYSNLFRDVVADKYIRRYNEYDPIPLSNRGLTFEQMIPMTLEEASVYVNELISDDALLEGYIENINNLERVAKSERKKELARFDLDGEKMLIQNKSIKKKIRTLKKESKIQK